MPLIVFDIDGTLTHTTDVDDASFVEAMRGVLGLGEFDSDWANYPHATDGGLCIEVSRRERGFDPTPAEMSAVQERFFASLRRHAAVPGKIGQVEGAARFIELLRRRGFAVSLATGAWRESARIKLVAAGLEHLIEGPDALPAAYADESISRAGIAALSIGRAGYDVREVQPIVYVGDGAWDARTSAAMGLGFVGMRVRGDHARLHAEGAREVVTNYADPEAVLACIERELKRTRSAPAGGGTMVGGFATMTVTAHLQRVLEAEIEANRRAIGSIRSALKQAECAGGPWTHGKPPAARAAEVMGHINSARYEWLVRLGVLPKRPFVMWPTCGIDEVERECVMLDAAWKKYLEMMDDTKLSVSVRYSSNEGTPWVSTVEEIVTHVLNHSTYHRGQISMLVHAAGGERATTDFIGITRRSGMAGGDETGGPGRTVTA